MTSVTIGRVHQDLRHIHRLSGSQSPHQGKGKCQWSFVRRMPDVRFGLRLISVALFWAVAAQKYIPRPFREAISCLLKTISR